MLLFVSKALRTLHFLSTFACHVCLSVYLLPSCPLDGNNIMLSLPFFIAAKVGETEHINFVTERATKASKRFIHTGKNDSQH